MKNNGKQKRANSSTGVIITLSAEQKRALRLRARRSGVSPSDFVRSVVHQYFDVR